MRTLLFPVAVLAFAVPEPLWAEEEKKRSDPKRVAELLEKLGDRNFHTREAAEKELVKAGEPALVAVRKAIQPTDVPEVGRRVERIERAILLNLRESKGSGMKFGLAEPGEFEMGSPDNEPSRWPDEALHTVAMHKPFLIGKHEVTQAEYKKVTGNTPSYFAATGEGKGRVANMNTDRFPVEQVSWFDAVAFCNALSKADGHEPYYDLTDTKTADGSITAGTVKVLGGSGFRLPTEAEWEYAGRATTRTAYTFGPITTGGNWGNFKHIVYVGYGTPEERPSLGRTTTVGSYKANRAGMYDVHGNAAEWCQDWYDKGFYAKSPLDNPTGPEKGDHKVIRGGSFMSAEGGCRSAARFYLTPGERKNYVGFRVARTP
jgi:formylglycine-generating enzyme required for sulfatase activity